MFEFPDGTTNEQIGAAVDEYFSGKARVSDTGWAEDAANVGLEAMAGVNRSATQLLDFLGPDQINAALELFGSDKRVPTLTETLSAGTAGGFMEEGLARDIVSAAGEVGGAAIAPQAALGKMAASLPKLVGQEGVAAGAVREMAKQGVGETAALSAASGAGQEIGQEYGGTTGGIAGSIVAPLIAMSSAGGLTKLLSNVTSANQLGNALESMSDDAAKNVLFDAMQKEGIGPGDVVARLEDLGGKGVLADAGESFRRTLRAIVNETPRLEGATKSQLAQRQQGQGERIVESFGKESGIGTGTISEAVESLEKATGPRIKELYDSALSKPIRFSPKLKALFEGDNSVSKAAKKAEARIADKRAAGDEISNIDLIDQTKRVMDDEINALMRQGKNNKARDIIRLKNAMLEEADAAIPEYKEARSLFAGKAALESAGDAGANIFKAKPADVKALVATMGDSEKKMFVLGAKEAIIDKIDQSAGTADIVRKIFSKGGDVKKLSHLFEAPADFARFEKAMRREAEFTATRNAITGNSTTARQLSDQQAVTDAMGLSDIATINPLALGRNIAAKMSESKTIKQKIAFEKGLEKAAKLLMKEDASKEIFDVLDKAAKENLDKILSSVFKTPIESKIAVPVGAAMAEDM